MNIHDIYMNQSKQISDLNRDSMKSAIKHDRSMKIHFVVGLLLRAALVFSIYMAFTSSSFC